jgi:hypothetical protein
VPTSSSFNSDVTQSSLDIQRGQLILRHGHWSQGTHFIDGTIFRRKSSFSRRRSSIVASHKATSRRISSYHLKLFDYPF